MKLSQQLELFTHGFAKWAGSACGLIVALISILIWLAAWKTIGFSQDRENGLTIYMGTITFLMVFLIQRSQNKELTILHAKLNELISATRHADNHIFNIEHLTEKEISEVQDIHRKMELTFNENRPKIN